MEPSRKYALSLDEKDPLKAFRSYFNFPKNPQGKRYIYLTGNSLGLQPKTATAAVNQELKDWAELAVLGHLNAKTPWYPYHEYLTDSTARLVGAKPIEVVVMNSLSVNLNLLLTSFYRPTPKRFRVMIEKNAFPSDRYAVLSHLNLHRQDPAEALVEVEPRSSEATLRPEDIQKKIDENQDSLALILFGNVQYLTGQAFPLKEMAGWAHKAGAYFGVDLAHGIGNLELTLHDDKVDFAAWCSYKYLNAGPGAVGGIFVHEKFAKSPELPRLSGWWGHDKKNRFLMSPNFEVMSGAEGWQISNPPILQLAALKASMEIFDKTSMTEIRKKSVQLTGFAEFLLNQTIKPTFVTPTDPAQRGAQLSIKIPKQGKQLADQLKNLGVLCDFREPDILRFAPVALYNSYSEIWQFVEILSKALR